MRITRKEAIKLLFTAIDHDDRLWEILCEEDYYDEKKDELLSLGEAFEAIGVTPTEFDEAVGTF